MSNLFFYIFRKRTAKLSDESWLQGLRRFIGFKDESKIKFFVQPDYNSNSKHGSTDLRFTFQIGLTELRLTFLTGSTVLYCTINISNTGSTELRFTFQTGSNDLRLTFQTWFNNNWTFLTGSTELRSTL